MEQKSGKKAGQKIKDLINLLARKGWIIKRWNRNFMGTRTPPFLCEKATALIAEVARADRSDRRNPFRWNGILFNIPGSKILVLQSVAG